MALYFHADSQKENEKRFMETRILTRLLYSFVLILALFSYVNLFRGYWYVLVEYFMKGMILLLHISNNKEYKYAKFLQICYIYL